MRGRQWRNYDVIADFADSVRLDRRHPISPRLASDGDTGDALEPGADLAFRAVGIGNFGQVWRARVVGSIGAFFRMHVLQQ